MKSGNGKVQKSIVSFVTKDEVFSSLILHLIEYFVYKIMADYQVSLLMAPKNITKKTHFMGLYIKSLLVIPDNERNHKQSE